MHEFQTFVYLPVQKTGSTFISALLDEFSKEEEVRHEAHTPMPKDFDPKKFYFISVRDPLDAYLSLYSFGSDARGAVHKKFEREGNGDLYDGTMLGFEVWLAHVIKPRNAADLGRRYATVGDGAIARLLGLQSYRYLRLALPPGALATCRTQDDIRKAYAERKLPRYVIRHETFAADLCALLRGPLRYAIRDVEAAVEFVQNAEPANSSDRVDKYQEEVRLGRRLQRKFLEREWFLHEEFGYQGERVSDCREVPADMPCTIFMSKPRLAQRSSASAS